MPGGDDQGNRSSRSNNGKKASPGKHRHGGRAELRKMKTLQSSEEVWRRLQSDRFLVVEITFKRTDHHTEAQPASVDERRYPVTQAVYPGVLLPDRVSETKAVTRRVEGENFRYGRTFISRFLCRYPAGRAGGPDPRRCEDAAGDPKYKRAPEPRYDEPHNRHTGGRGEDDGEREDRAEERPGRVVHPHPEGRSEREEVKAHYQGDGIHSG